MNDDELRRLLALTATRIGAQIDELFEIVAKVRARVEDLSSRALELRKPFDRTTLAAVRPTLQTLLREDVPVLEGIGVAVGAGALSDTPHWLEWWRRDNTHDSHFISHVLNPQSVNFYDYQDREWFSEPLQASRPLAIGPYIDAGGIEVCTVTLAMPLTLPTGGSVVAGGDLSMPALERFTLSALRIRQPAVALVSANDRILVSNSGRYVTGGRLHADAHITHSVAVPSADPARLHWRLLALDIDGR